MIGIHHKGYKIIAALPVNGAEDQSHMIVVGQSLPQEGKRHQPRFVTWFTDSNGLFDSPIHFTDHAAYASTLRNMAIGNMISRAGHLMSALMR